MNRKDFVNEVFEKLEKNHINLYHDISKTEFEKCKNKFLKDVDNLDEVHFQGGMLKLFSLFKEAHLSYYTDLENHVYADFYQIGKEYFLYDDGEYKKITKINGINIDTVVEKLKTLVPYEVDTWAYRQIKSLIDSPVSLQMVDCGKDNFKITYNLGLKKVVKKTLTDEEIAELVKNKPKEKWYDYKTLKNGEILYVKFATCNNIKGYEFSKFVDDMAKNLNKKPTACIVDVRFNRGGNSDVIMPLIDYLKKKQIKTYALMNNGTFSSATFALAYLKKDLKATFVGVEAGQPTSAYGNTHYLEVDGKTFTNCDRYFELSKVHNKQYPVEPFLPVDAFDYSGIIKPDVKIEMKIEDVNKGIDTQLDGCVKVIENDLKEISKNFISKN